MSDKTSYDIIADFTHDWIEKFVWVELGRPIPSDIDKLTAWGFSPVEARYWLMILTVLALYRLDFPMGPVWHEFKAPPPPQITWNGMNWVDSEGNIVPYSDPYITPPFSW